MKQFTACVFGASLLAATSAFAQSSVIGDRFYIIGYGELGHFDAGSFDDDLYRIDIDMGLAPPSGANGLGLGFSLGIDAFGSSGFDASALYPAVELGTGIGKFSFGVPRSVLDRGYLSEHKFANNSFVDVEIRTLEASVLGAHYLDSDDSVWGLRYDGSFGDTKVGASYHFIDSTGSDAEAFALAASHTFESAGSMADFMVYGGVEHLVAGSSDFTSYRIGVEGYWDRMTAGLSYTDQGASSSLSFTTVYVDYKAMDNLTLTGSLGRIESGSGQNIYGLGVQYDFLKGAYAKASFVDTDSSGSDPFVEVMVGWKF
ncbi:MAG: hypothetical protein KAT26_09195 [Marinosulfonomonas sp.]|nr:hypothetical protein [Marinosulfonomonas sp.]